MRVELLFIRLAEFPGCTDVTIRWDDTSDMWHATATNGQWGHSARSPVGEDAVRALWDKLQELGRECLLVKS